MIQNHIIKEEIGKKWIYYNGLTKHQYLKNNIWLLQEKKFHQIRTYESQDICIQSLVKSTTLKFIAFPVQF